MDDVGWMRATPVPLCGPCARAGAACPLHTCVHGQGFVLGLPVVDSNEEVLAQLGSVVGAVLGGGGGKAASAGLVLCWSSINRAKSKVSVSCISTSSRVCIEWRASCINSLIPVRQKACPACAVRMASKDKGETAPGTH